MEPIDTVTRSLTIEEVVDLIEKEKVNAKASCEPCIRPKGGQVFVFSAVSNPSRKNDWRVDQYFWVNNGVTKLPRTSPVLKKIYIGKIKKSLTRNSNVMHTNYLTMM